MGREFVELFDHWAESYDQSVSGNDLEYKEVFSNYNYILENVVNLVNGNVVEFGVGTGNLTQKLLEKGYNVIGIEPSRIMREMTKKKLPNLELYNGDFQDFYTPVPVDGFVSTYAFHHLNDIEKAEAIAKYSNLLSKGGKVVFADTVFETEKTKIKTIEKAKKNQFLNLAKDLETEYYTTIPVLEAIFRSNEFDVEFIQQNPYVWLIHATKQ